MTTETDPSGLFGMLGAGVAATLTLLVAFGVDLTEEQTSAVLGFVATVGPLVVALLIRRKAWAPGSVEVVADEAYARGRGGDPLPTTDHLLELGEARRD